MNLIAVITSDDLPALLREQPELAAAHDEHGVSALLLAIYHRRPEARDALLAAGRRSGRCEAAALGDVERLEGADLSIRGGDGFTPLHLAAFFGGAEAVGAILATGADPDADADNPFKRPPAALRLRPGTSSPPRAARGGSEPEPRPAARLHAAAQRRAHRRRRADALLLEHGADRRATEDNGKTPYEMAGEATRALLSP